MFELHRVQPAEGVRLSDLLSPLKLQLAELARRERAELAMFLIQSLDDGSDDDAAEAWEAELNRRVAEIKQGRARGIPAEQVFAELRRS